MNKPSPISFRGSAYIALLALLFWSGPGKGVAQIKTYQVTAFQEEEGLPNLQASGMIVGSNGQIIFDTQGGLIEFDGFRWKKIPGSDTLGRAIPNSLRALAPNRLSWLSSQDNQLYLNLAQEGTIQRSLVPINLAYKTIDFPTIAYQPDSKVGPLAVVHQGALHFYEGTNLTASIPLPKSLAHIAVNQLIYFKKQLILCTANGLYAFNEYSQRFRRYWPEEFAAKNILRAAVAPDGESLYLLGNNWLAEWKNQKLSFRIQKIYSSNNLSYTPIYTCLLPLDEKTVLFSHNQSLSIFNKATGERSSFRLSNPFSGAMPTQIAQDVEGNLWFTTLRGVARLNSLAIASIDKVAGLPDSEVTSILETRAGDLIIGTNLGINIYNDSSWVRLADPINHNNPGNTRVLDAIQATNGKVYIAANEQGLGILDQKHSIQWYPLPANNLATSVVELEGKVLIGTNNGRIYELGDQHEFKLKIFLGHHYYCRRLYANAQKQIVALTNNGVFKGSYASREFKPVDAGAPYAQFYTLTPYQDDTLLGTAKGLVRLSGGKMQLVQHDSLQNNRPVYALLNLADTVIWAGTNRGIFTFNGQHQKFIGFNQGLAGHEVNRKALLRGSEGKIWIGTDGGLNTYDYTYQANWQVVPRVRIHSVQSEFNAYKQLQRAQPLSLPYDENSLEFTFAATTFSNPAATVFRYRLAGLEKDWNISQNYLQSSVRYPALDPGNYQFMVQARVGNGRWSKLVLSSTIEVQQPWFKRWWAIGLGMLLSCILVYLLYYLALQDKIKNRLREAVEKTRADALLSESKFKAIWEAIDTGLVVVNFNGKIVMANPASRYTFKDSEQNLVGSYLDEILNHSKFTRSYIKSYYQKPHPIKFELTDVRHGTTRHLLTSFSLVKMMANIEPHIIVSFKNITNLKETELKNARLNELLTRQNRDLLRKEGELATSNRKLIHQQKELRDALKILEERNFELDQFVYKTSHDLRAPIASSLGLLNLMKLKEEEPKWKDYAALIEKSLKKQDTFISAMLNFSKSTRAEIEVQALVLEEVIRQCIGELQYLPQFNEVQHSFTLHGEPQEFRSERMKLQIIFTNILANGIKYRDPAKKSRLDIHIETTAQKAIVIISDNGIGISQPYVSKIFDMFYRATEQSDGSGLGLYIVKQTIERLKGSIEVESEVGLGTSFRIEIPNSAPTSEPSLSTAPNELDNVITLREDAKPD